MNVPAYLQEYFERDDHGVLVYYIPRELTPQDLQQLSHLHYKIAPDVSYINHYLGTTVRIYPTAEGGDSFVWKPSCKIRVSKGKRGG